MAPARKSRRQSKPPAKLQDFVYEDGREKEKIEITPDKKKNEATKNSRKKSITRIETPEKKQPEDSQEPRRSGRTPKLSEKLKSYLKGDAKKEKSESSVKKQAKKSSTINLSSLTDFGDLKEPKVLLKKLSVSSPVTKQQVKVNEGQEVKDPVFVSYTERSENFQRNKITKRKSEIKCEIEAENFRKSARHKKSKLSNGSSEKLQPDETQEGTVIPAKQINKDIMTQLINFGAEIAEAMESNNEKILEITTKESSTHNPLHTFKIDGDQDFDEDEVGKILDWLQKEEEQRGLYRKKIIDSMRASHDSNMALFSQLLNMLQSLSSSLRC